MSLLDFPLIFEAFGLLFLLEIGDKTQLVVLSLTAQTRRGRVVFLGAAVTLAVVTLLGVAIGVVAVELAPRAWITRLSASVFIALGIYLLWSTRRHGAKAEADESKAAEAADARGAFSVLAMTSGLIFVAEMGDKSQLSAIALTARTGHPLEVFLGAALGLTAVTLLGVLTGGAIARRVPERWITRGAAAFFVVAGVFVLLGVF